MSRRTDDYEDDWELPEPDESDDDDDESETIPCPACGALIYEEAVACPECGTYVTAVTSAWSDRPWWWIVLGLLGVAAMLWVLLWVFF